MQGNAGAARHPHVCKRMHPYADELAPKKRSYGTHTYKQARTHARGHAHTQARICEGGGRTGHRMDMCIGMCAVMSIAMGIDICMGMGLGMCTGMYVGMCIGMDVCMCIGMYVGMYVGMCIGMCIGSCTGI